MSFLANVHASVRAFLAATDNAGRRSALGLGTAAVASTTDFDAAGAAAAITLSGLGAGDAATHSAADFDPAGAAAAITLSGLGAGNAATHSASDFDPAGAAAAITLSGLGAGTSAVLDVDHGVGAVVSNTMLGEILGGAGFINGIGIDQPVTAMGVAALPSPLTGAIYNNGAKTLTAGINGDISGMLPLNSIVMFFFTSTDKSVGGIYKLTDVGSAGSKAVFTRDTSMASSGDFVNGKVFRYAAGSPPTWYELVVSGAFTLDSTDVVFRQMNADQIVSLGFSHQVGGTAGQTLVGNGSGSTVPTTADVSALLAAANNAAILAALGLPAVPTVQIVSADHTAVAGEVVFANASGGNVVITLPASPAAGTIVRVQRRDSSGNTLTVSSGGADLNSGSSITLDVQYDSIDFIYDGVGEWGTF